jgi:ribonucleoside-triphosphate reductase
MNKPEPKPELKVPVEVYSRVCGFYTPVQGWNPGKTQEFLNRKEYLIPEDYKLYQRRNTNEN